MVRSASQNALEEGKMPLVTPDQIPGFKKLVTVLHDPTYAPPLSTNIYDIRREKLRTLFYSLYRKVSAGNVPDPVVLQLAYARAEMVIFGVGYRPEIEEAIDTLDTRITEELVKNTPKRAA